MTELTTTELVLLRHAVAVTLDSCENDGDAGIECFEEYSVIDSKLFYIINERRNQNGVETKSNEQGN